MPKPAAGHPANNGGFAYRPVHNHTLAQRPHATLERRLPVLLHAGKRPMGLAFAGNSTWVAKSFSNSVTRLSAAGAVLGAYAGGKGPVGVAGQGDSVWLTNFFGKSVLNCGRRTDSSWARSQLVTAAGRELRQLFGFDNSC